MTEIIKGALSDVPKNFNPQYPQQFRFHFKRMPHVSYFVNKVSLPGISLGSADEATPYLNIPQPGDHIVFEPLILNFVVTEGLQNYIELQKWLLTIGNLEGQEAYDKLNINPNFINHGVKSEILFSILDSSKNPIIEVDFLDAWPTSLTKLDFDVTVSGDEARNLNATAVFRYSEYHFRPSP
jgi:hypothetical protein